MNKSVSDNPMELSPESLSHFDLEDDEDSINEFVSVKEEGLRTMLTLRT